tara:strand:- start:618 stop:785 length:168 start_codon:yes stop_codon:yes gene_type:complete
MLFIAIGYMLTAVTVGVSLVEFIGGCGEIEYNLVAGTWKTLPCVFVPYETVTGFM